MTGKRLILTVLLAMPCMATLGQTDGFDRWFSGGTLRVDCMREGSSLGDTVWIQQWLDRRAEWHGSRTHLLDPFDNGDYRVVMRDAETGRDLYSRCYNNLFREYKDTPEGQRNVGRFEETLLLPMPRHAVQIVLQRRNKAMRLEDQTVVRFNPDSIRLERVRGARPAIELEINGPVNEKIDVVIVAQGYADTSIDKMYNDLDRMKNILFGKEPFASHRSDFNVRGVRAEVGAEYNTFGIDRYLMTFHLWQLHDALGSTPADYIIIMVNNDTYGGGAIYNFYSVSSLHSMAEFVLPHELGHGIGGLADEYVDEDLSYADLHRTHYEPLEPNITNMVDFESKWKQLIPKGTPIPTPPSNAVLRSQCGPIGAYEGAGYSRKGVYRPTMRCMMRDYAPFCPVCHKRLEQIFKLYTE